MHQIIASVCINDAPKIATLIALLSNEYAKKYCKPSVLLILGSSIMSFICLRSSFFRPLIADLITSH